VISKWYDYFHLRADNNGDAQHNFHCVTSSGLRSHIGWSYQVQREPRQNYKERVQIREFHVIRVQSLTQEEMSSGRV
jgi:hypothetical protein